MTDTTTPALLTTREVAAIARLSPRTVAHAAQTQALRSIQGGRGRGLRYRREWVADWLGLDINELPSPIDQAAAS